MPSASCCFFLVFVFYRKSIPNGVQMERNFLRIFLGPEDNHEASGGGQKTHAGATSLRGMPLGLWAHHSSPNPNLCSINTQIFPIYQRAHQKYFSVATSFCPCGIPSGDLFRYSARGGFDHGGPLHQPCWPSNDL